MTSSMVSAMILSDLVQEREHPFAEVFSPSRSIFRPPPLCQRLGSHGQSADTHHKAMPPSGPRAEMEFPGTDLGLSLSRFPL